MHKYMRHNCSNTEVITREFAVMMYGKENHVCICIYVLLYVYVCVYACMSDPTNFDG